MMRNMKRGLPSLMKQGTTHQTAADATIFKNIDACKALTDITRTSLGPNGMNKMIINHLDKLFVTSDTATIIKEMEIQHPAAKMIVMAAAMQETEIGDGSNFVVCFAGELLNKAADLLNLGLHASEVVAGYSKAIKACMEYLDDCAIETAEDKHFEDVAYMARAVRSAVAAKQNGNEEFLSTLCAKACLTVMPKNRYNFAVGNVRVCKVLGGSLFDSEVVDGVVINRGVEGTVSDVSDAKVAVFTCGIEPASTETKGNVLIESAQQLLDYNQGEEKQLEAEIKSIADSGVKVIVAGGNIDDMAKHFINKFGMLAIKIASKFELRRICEAVRARPLVSVGPVSEEHQGYCSRAYVREVGGSSVIVLEQKNIEATGISTVMLRASTFNVLNDVERAIDDGVNTIRAMGRDARFVAGAGACDIELARRLTELGDKSSGLEQYAIKKFAEALEVVPRVLAENTGRDAMDVISHLYAEHEKGNVNAGVNIKTGKDMSIDAKEKNLIDLLIVKASALRLATNAVLSVLRVDQVISAKQAGGPRMPQNQGHWDDN